MKLSSFKNTVSNIPLPPRTPSPILDLVEPLTPTDPTAYKDGPLYPSNAATGLAEALQSYGWARDGPRDHEPARPEKAQNGNAERATRSSRHVSGKDSRSSSHGSPIDALADVASSMAPSPVFAPPPVHPPQVQAFPQLATRPAGNGSRHAHTASDGQSYRYSQSYIYGYDHGYGCDERPSKRARSEVAPSQQYTQGSSRPATSHTPSVDWSYHVEQATQAGHHTYHEQVLYASNAANNDEMDIAQVLLGLRNGSIDSSRGARRSFAEPPPTFSHNGFSGWREIPETHVHPPAEVQYQEHGLVDGHHQLRPHADSFFAPEPAPFVNGTEAIEGKPSHKSLSAMQTRTPPEDAYDPSNIHGINMNPTQAENKKGKGHQGWPKGKPRGPRNKAANGRKSSKASGKVNDTMLVPVRDDGSDQLQSPQSLPGELPEGTALEKKQMALRQRQEPGSDFAQVRADMESTKRRNSFAEFSLPATEESRDRRPPVGRASSVPADASMTIKPAGALGSGQPPSAVPAEEVTICAGCNFSRGPSTGQKDQWIGCNGCQNWYHFACAGFKNAKEVSGVDKYFCRACRSKFGPTTFVRKSKRAHTAVDYAGLNEGVLRTSEDEYEHHYIEAIKDGTFKFQPETFPRMRPELLTAENLEKSGGFNEPIVIPASWNPRPNFPGTQAEMPDMAASDQAEQPDDFYEDLDYETVPDDGQDLLDMVIPQGLTVRRVAELYGPEEKVEVIDVKSQEGEDKRWNMNKWAEYYEEEGEKPVRNVISLEVSHSKLGRLIRRPKVVRDLDLQDAVWPEEETARGVFPKVQFYCLMSVADCYTDFHIDFGGSSVYYHIIKGKKTFFFIPPKKQHLKKYEDWCLSQAQNWTFLADETKECYRVDLSEGDTMLIPSGWIHAVWTPENSLVIGGNFLTRLNYGMQIRIAEIEKNTKVARKFRYPHFQKVLWYTVLQYLRRDPLPPSVVELFYDGKQFGREKPAYLEPDKFGHNSDPGPENYNARYYARSELDGLPDLISYIFRTVMISQGRVEGITAEVRNAVTKSIPKGCGDPLDIIKAFAMWAAWKRGNEDIPQWAHPDAILPEAGESGGDKKLSNAALKRLERKAFIDAFRLAPERQSARQRTKALEAEIPDTSPSPGSSTMVGQAVKHTSTPKTSVLGPKRIACDACRKRRIRCKHKDEVSSPNAANANRPGERRPSAQMVAVVIPSSEKAGIGGAVNGVFPQKMDAQLAAVLAAGSSDLQPQYETPDSKRGRSKACLDCRKSKRRCIHDEYGNIDPIKAQETPIPRGSQSTKKRRISGSGEDADGLKKPKKELRPSPSLPTGSSLSDGDTMHGGQVRPEQEIPLEPQPHPEVTFSSDISIPDAPVDSINGAIDPMLEAYSSHIDPIEEEVDQIMVNGVDPVEPPPEAADVKSTPASDVALPSTEEVLEQAAAEHQPSPTDMAKPAPPQMPNGVPLSSPLTDLAISVSPEQPRRDNNFPPGPESPSERRHSSRTSRPIERYSTTSSVGIQSQPPKPAYRTTSRTTSRTPAPINSTIAVKPASTPVNQRRQSNASVYFLPTTSSKDASVKSEPKQRAMSQTVAPEEDEASMRLVRELMGEDRGLRRRGSR